MTKFEDCEYICMVITPPSFPLPPLSTPFLASFSLFSALATRLHRGLFQGFVRYMYIYTYMVQVCYITCTCVYMSILDATLNQQISQCTPCIPSSYCLLFINGNSFPPPNDATLFLYHFSNLSHSPSFSPSPPSFPLITLPHNPSTDSL